jgi:hypothetical protein
MRKTVTITTPDNPTPRQFHLGEDKAQAFAAKIIAKGGTAMIGPLQLGPELQAILARAQACVKL